jgi:hypothetical protein
VTNPQSRTIATRSRASHDEARPEPARAPYAELWIKDAAYIDPMLDAWGRDVVCGLIEGLQAGFRGLTGALEYMIERRRRLLRGSRSERHERPSSDEDGYALRVRAAPPRSC